MLHFCPHANCSGLVPEEFRSNRKDVNNMDFLEASKIFSYRTTDPKETIRNPIRTFREFTLYTNRTANHKASGKDRMPADLFKRAPEAFRKRTGILINIILSGHYVCSEAMLEARVVLLCKDHANPSSLSNYRPIALCNALYQLINIIITSRLRRLTEKYAVLESSQHGFRGSRSVQLVIQKERLLLRQAMKQDSKLIRVDLDFKNAFNSAGHSSLRKILEGFGIPDVSLLSSIYERSTMRILVGNERSAAIQLDTGTVQGSALSSFLFDLFINALLRLLDSTGILHRVRGVPEWNLQAFADDLSLYVSSTEDANTLLKLVGSFQEWSGLKISIKKSLVTGALYGQGEIHRQRDAMAVIRKRKPPPEAQRLSRSKLQETQELEQMDPDFEEDLTPVDEEINEACEELRSRSLLQRCDTCGRHRDKHHFPSSATNQCTQCSKSWTPRGIAYQGETLKVIRGRTPT